MLSSWHVLGPVGYGPSHHLKSLNSSLGQLITIPTSSFLAFLNPSNCTISLPSICTKLKRDYQTHRGVTLAPYYQHSTSFISNSTSSLHTLGISHISRQNSYLSCPKSTSWNIIILSRGEISSQGTTTLKMLQFFHRPYFSYPRKWSKYFFIE